MTVEIRNNGITDITVLIADEGKVFRRIGTNEIFGSEIWLGYSYYINGVRQNPPHLDVQADFEEIDEPEPEPYVEPDPIPEPEPQISDTDALNIITGKINDITGSNTV